jgi:putative tryptophan/tyrosine transport system substrate-binding protein
MLPLKRREFITLLGGTAAWPLAAHAQQQAKVARIGYLGLGPASATSSRVEALRAGLRDLGRVEGKNIVISFVGRTGSSSCPNSRPNLCA